LRKLFSLMTTMTQTAQRSRFSSQVRKDYYYQHYTCHRMKWQRSVEM
jgi:hypothetical protein